MNIVYFKQFVYNHLPLAWYMQRYLPDYCHVGENIPPHWLTDYDEVSDLIYNLLSMDKPCLVARYGANEFTCMENFIKGHHPFCFLRKIWPFWVKDSVMSNMINNAGFFGATGYKSYARFADLLYDCGKQTDILACWFKNHQIVEKEMNYRLVFLLSIEPWWSKNPWTRYLNGKKVLIVHPFSETIKSQYKKRELLFDNPDVLPEFESLAVIKAVQSIGGIDNGFKDWFDALHFMEQQIDAIDYDVALIGCGAYGMPLAAHCKKMGKKAVHLGGALQLLFGIKGNRWLDNYGNGKSYIPDYPKLLSNPNWVKPSGDDRPKTADNVENACYW